MNYKATVTLNSSILCLQRIATKRSARNSSLTLDYKTERQQQRKKVLEFWLQFGGKIANQEMSCIGPKPLPPLSRMHLEFCTPNDWLLSDSLSVILFAFDFAKKWVQQTNSTVFEWFSNGSANSSKSVCQAFGSDVRLLLLSEIFAMCCRLCDTLLSIVLSHCFFGLTFAFIFRMA